MTLRPFGITQGRYRATSRYRRGIQSNNGLAHPSTLLGMSPEQCRRAQGHKVVAIVPAAGSGRRFSSREKKPFVLLKGRPIVAYALKVLESSTLIDNIVVAAHRGSIGRLKGIINKYGFKKVTSVVPGGRTRGKSVRNCFKVIDSSCRFVLIHDGARPFLKPWMIRDSIALAGKFGACVTAIPVTDTIKAADRNFFVLKTLDRKRLWRAQTPQTFKYALLKSVLDGSGYDPDLTDDTALLERAGKRVKILEGSADNMKITTKKDLKTAEALL